MSTTHHMFFMIRITRNYAQPSTTTSKQLSAKTTFCWRTWSTALYTQSCRSAKTVRHWRYTDTKSHYFAPLVSRHSQHRATRISPPRATMHSCVLMIPTSMQLERTRPAPKDNYFRQSHFPKALVHTKCLQTRG